MIVQDFFFRNWSPLKLWNLIFVVSFLFQISPKFISVYFVIIFIIKKNVFPLTNIFKITLKHSSMIVYLLVLK